MATTWLATSSKQAHVGTVWYGPSSLVGRS